jgi:hypothetical protein
MGIERLRFRVGQDEVRVHAAELPPFAKGGQGAEHIVASSSAAPVPVVFLISI